MGKYNEFSNLKSARDITKYTLMRGSPDWSAPQQFDFYESGYPYLAVVSIPEYMEKMASADADVRKLVDNFVHILEYEFKGWDSGLENMTGETQEITNGKKSLQLITSTTAQGGSTFSATYNERSGTPITKFAEKFLRNTRDPDSGFKHYGGLIGFGSDQIHPADAGLHKEIFSFLYMHTDNTGLLLERAVYITNAQLTVSEQSIYNGTKGQVEFKEISVEFSGFPIVGSAVDQRAQEVLNYMNNPKNPNMVVRDSYNFNYSALQDTSMLAKSSLIGGR